MAPIGHRSEDVCHRQESNNGIRGASATVFELASSLKEIISRLISPGERCALLDFPNHSNVGDSAIWLGEKAALARVGARIVYECDRKTYSRTVLARRIGDGTILIHGGGNFGDIWRPHQAFREAIVASFPERKIIQLPQTIHFQDGRNLESARSVINRHRNFVLLARDLRSLGVAQEAFDVPAYACPDSAFALGAIRRPRKEEVPIVWLRRTDREGTQARASDLEGLGKGVDWVAEDRTLIFRICGRLTALGSRHEALRGALHRCTRSAFDLLARQRVWRGCRILAGGRVVITDRLHGHILCLLMGIPHVLLDNNYGKNRSFFESWTRKCGLVFWADDPIEAQKLARELGRGAA